MPMDINTALMSLVVVTIDALAIIRIMQSSAQTINKFFWIVVVLLLPILGAGIWWFFGPK
jgi:hypothetical protein